MTWGLTHGQKNIPINDSLAAYADTWKVKLGTQGFGKLWKLHFGEYGIVTSKRGWQTDKLKTNLLGNQLESKSTLKFSFVLNEKGSDTAFVNAANNVQVKALQEMAVYSNITWGDDKISSRSDNFTAFITINQDTADLWILFYHEYINEANEQSPYAFLTNGTRKLLINPVGSKKGGLLSIPAAGFEFAENGHSLCALEYVGGVGMNNNLVWMDRRQDARTKLILSAAVTALLELKLAEEETQ